MTARWWIDICDSAGARYGDGPITGATLWESEDELDATGKFRFVLPAADPHRALIQSRRYVYCYQVVNGVVTEVGAGRIEEIRKVKGRAGSPTMIEVAGRGLLCELADRSVLFLEINERGFVAPIKVWYYDSGTTSYTDLDYLYDGNSVTGAGVNLDVGDYLYIGASNPFTSVRFDQTDHTANTEEATLTWEYWDGASWTAQTITYDTTQVAGCPFGATGEVERAAPVDWATATVNGQSAYWVRVSTSADLSDGASEGEIEVKSTIPPASTAVADVLALGPAGWTVDTGRGFAGTLDLIIAEFAGESVLNALIKLAGHVGEHFRRGTGRTVVWLRKAGSGKYTHLGVTGAFEAGETVTGGTSGATGTYAAGTAGVAGYLYLTDVSGQFVNSETVTGGDSGATAQLVTIYNPDCGVTALNVRDPIAAESNTDVCALTELEEIQDAYDQYNRVYPWGSGNGRVRQSLRSATWTAPTDYEIDTDDNFIRNTAKETADGRIERALEYSEIRPLYNTIPDVIAAANELAKVAYEDLLRHLDPHQAYASTVAKLDQVVYPGEQMRHQYREVVDGEQAFDVDRMLNILGVRTVIDARGRRTAGMTVATIDEWPKRDTDIIAGRLEQGRIYTRHPQLNACLFAIHFDEVLDDDEAAVIPFWLGAEIVNVNGGVVRFKVEALVSPVKSVGGTSTSTDENTINTNHYHMVVLTNGTSGNPVYAGSGNLQVSGGGTFGGTDDADTTHAHDVTALVTTTFGRYVAPQEDTLIESDLAYSLNGGADLGASVRNISAGWYELDITDDLIDTTTLRPAQAANELVISTATADKYCRVVGDIYIRAVVQGDAVL